MSNAYLNRIESLSRRLQWYEETEIKLKYLTGYDLADLLTLFAKGYTLTLTLPPPKYASLVEALNEGETL